MLSCGFVPAIGTQTEVKTPQHLPQLRCRLEGCGAEAIKPCSKVVIYPGFFLCAEGSSLLVVEGVCKRVPRVPISAILPMLVVKAVCSSQHPSGLHVFKHCTVVDCSDWNK